MNVVIFGATGMVGQGVLREALAALDVKIVLAVGRTPLGARDPKMREQTLDKLTVEDVRGFDACFFCLGTPSAGKAEAEYTKVTYDLTMHVAAILKQANPRLTFVYVSGVGADGTEKGTVMWARVRGRVENALFALFENAYVFRPGGIESKNGERSKVRLYRVSYVLMKPLIPLLRMLAPDAFTDTETVGRAMLNVARRGSPVKILHAADLAQRSQS